MEYFKTQIQQKTSTAASRIQQEVGASTIFLLGVLPLLCGLIFGLMAVLSATQAKMIPLQICRQQNLKLQEQAEKSILSLLKLNPIVSALRVEKKAAEVALAAAVLSANPPAIAAAHRALSAAKTSLASLKLNQLRILSQQKILSLKTQLAAQKDARLEINGLSQRLAFFLKIQLHSFSSDLHSLAVKPDVPTDEAAIYERDEPFSERETSHGSWKLSLTINEQHWLNNFLHNQIIWQGSCKASLFKEHSQWLPGLIR